ncbi:MAG: cell division protein FtsA [Rikenellaceae bacterium]|nr:cell division protein FtsA [Rikenellaceae bacterium]
MEKKQYIVALDLGGSSVKIALGSVNDDLLTVEDIVCKELAANGMNRGAINNRQVVSNAIRNAVDELEHRNGIRISDVHTGVSDKDIKCATHDYHVYISHSDGEIAREDVNKLHDGMYNVTAENNARILERIPQIYRVYKPEGVSEVSDPVGCFGKKLGATFTFVLGNDNMIVRYENTLAGLSPKLSARTLTAGPMFAVQATAIEDEIEMGVVVLDIGRDTTDLCICKDGIVRYVRTIPIGSGDINTDIRGFGIPESKVESIKRNHGQALADEIKEDATIKAGPSRKQSISISRKALATIIEYRLKDIVRYVKEEIRDSGYMDKLQCGVLLTGGGANLVNIDKMFERELGMEVRVAQPNLHVVTPEGKEELLEKPEFATVIGMLHNAKAKALYNSVEVIRSMQPVVTPAVQEEEVVRPVESKPTVEVKPKPVTPSHPVEKSPVVEKPVVEKPIEQPKVEQPKEEVKEQATDEPSAATTHNSESPKNPIVDSIRGKVNELRGGGSSESAEESHDEEQKQEESDEDKNSWRGRLRHWRDKIRDAVFPETVEDDDISSFH